MRQAAPGGQPLADPRRTRNPHPSRSITRDEVDHDLVGEIVDARVAQGVSNATIKRDLCALSSVIQYARARKWRSMENPALDWMQMVTAEAEFRGRSMIPSSA